MRTSRRKAVAVLLALLSIGTAAGCGDDDPTDTSSDIYYRYEDRDDMMEAFAEIYESMYLAGLDDLLHPKFVLDPRADTAETWDWANGTTLDRDDFLEIHENLYDGDGGTDATQVSLQPIASVVIDKLEQLADWAVIGSNDGVFGEIDGYYAEFDCQIVFYNPDLYHYYLVRQPLEFYVTQRSYDGDVFWQIIGIRCPDDGTVRGIRSYDDLLVCYF